MGFKKTIVALVAILVMIFGIGWSQEQYTAKTVFVPKPKDSYGYSHRATPYLVVSDQQNNVIQKQTLSSEDGYYLKNNYLVVFKQLDSVPYNKYKYVSATVYSINQRRLELAIEIQKSNKAYILNSCMAYPLYENKSMCRNIGEDILDQTSLNE